MNVRETTLVSDRDPVVIHLTVQLECMSAESDDRSDRERARESLLSGGERVSKGRQRSTDGDDEADEN